MSSVLKYVVACSMLIASTGLAQAQPSLASAKQDPAQQSKQQTMSANELATLIRSTIMALQHANQTGNYSVLRDLGTPVFRERYDQAALAGAFARLRGRGVNLNPAMTVDLNLTRPPELTQQNQLHLAGYVRTQPLQIKYEMLFLQIDGVWRIEGLMIDAVPTEAAVPASFSTRTEARP